MSSITGHKIWVLNYHTFSAEPREVRGEVSQFTPGGGLLLASGYNKMTLSVLSSVAGSYLLPTTKSLMFGSYCMKTIRLFRTGKLNYKLCVGSKFIVH